MENKNLNSVKDKIRQAYLAKQARQESLDLALKIVEEEQEKESENKEQHKKNAREKLSSIKDDDVLKDIKAELIGSWIWVDADKIGTIASALKARGFWMSRRGRWCWTSDIKKPDGRKRNRHASMDGIRSKYGSRWTTLEEARA